MGAPNKQEDMEFLVLLYESKQVVPIIDQVFPLDQAPEAIQYLKDGKSKGKIVITMD